MKKIRAIIVMLALTLVAGMGLSIGTNYASTPTASAATGGNCPVFGAPSCQQRITVNTVSQHTITVSYGSGSGNFYLPRANTYDFYCGNAAGVYRMYVHSGYNVRIRGYFGVNSKENSIVTLYYQSTGWHTLPANFRSPRCNNVNVGYIKYGEIQDAYEYKQ